jgi:5-methylcytosine-specific restriction endonuclease McrA
MAPDELKTIRANSRVLVLNASFEPLNIASWKRAVLLILKQKAVMVSHSVIRLVEYIKLPLSKMRVMRPSRALVYKRDGHKCQYCGSTRRLTIDHVLARSRGGGNTWDNLVVACSSCNTKKGDKLLEQTGMKLAKKPKAPFNKASFTAEYDGTDEWREYVFV